MIDKRILPLAIGGLGIGTTEFTIMGLLPDMARSFDVSIPHAGWLISAYALGVVVGAPLLIGMSLRYPPKRTLTFLMVLFVVFNGLSAITPNFPLMLAVRFLSGLPHGAFFGVGAVVAAQLGGKGKEARYISLMFSGLTVANLIMVPAVTWLGHAFHWRWYFAIVAVIGLLTLLLIYRLLPAIPAKQQVDFKKEVSFLKSKESWYVLIITAIGFGGLFTWFSYIAPLMTSVSGISESNMAYVMVLAGAGMVVGNIAGGILSDRIGASRTTVIMLALMALSLLIVFSLSHYTVLALVMTFLCGALSMSMGSPLNMMIMKAAPGSEMMAAAFMQAGFNIANSAGAYLGGIPLLFGLSYTYPSLVGVGMTLIGLVVSIVYMVKYQAASMPAVEGKSAFQ